MSLLTQRVAGISSPEDRPGADPCAAAFGGDIDIVHLLLETSTDVNARGLINGFIYRALLAAVVATRSSTDFCWIRGLMGIKKELHLTPRALSFMPLL